MGTVSTTAEAIQPILRLARPGDEFALRALFPDKELDEIERFLLSSTAVSGPERNTCIIAEWGGTVVGCGRLVKWHRGIEIADLVVDPQHRRRGIGRTLIEALLEIARRWKISRVQIGARIEDQMTIAWYQKLGFARERRIDLVVDGNPSTLVYLFRDVEDSATRRPQPADG